MEAIIAAIISAGATLIGAALTYNYTLRKIKESTELLPSLEKSIEKRAGEHGSLSKEHGSLSKEHDGLSKEHDGLSKEHMSILSQGRETYSKIDGIYSMTVDEKAKAELRFSQLSEKDRDALSMMKDFENAVRNLQEKFIVLQLESAKLNRENEILKAQIDGLEADKLREQENGRVLSEETRRLKEEINNKAVKPSPQSLNNHLGFDR